MTSASRVGQFFISSRNGQYRQREREKRGKEERKIERERESENKLNFCHPINLSQLAKSIDDRTPPFGADDADRRKATFVVSRCMKNAIVHVTGLAAMWDRKRRKSASRVHKRARAALSRDEAVIECDCRPSVPERSLWRKKKDEKKGRERR